MSIQSERVWAEISIENLRFNYNQAKRLCPSAQVMPVIKANAYGHGSVAVANILSQQNVSYFAVATPSEAYELRAAGISQEILILGAVPVEHIPKMIENNIIVSIASYEAALLYHQKLGQGKLRVHIKLDTGMSRYGISALHDTKAAVAEIKRIVALNGLSCEGLFSHFSVADSDNGREYTNLQITRFEEVRRMLEQDGITFLFYHCANSAGLIRFGDSHYNMVRAGIMLYGTHPDTDLLNDIELRPVMSLKTVINQIRTLPAGDTVGYGRTYHSDSERKIATLSIGYADGLIRFGSNKYEMLVRGQRVPQVGRVCMDICMIDVTDVPDVSVGDVVTIFGQDGDERISVEEYAKHAGSFNYEALCAISARVPRYYVDE